MNEGNEAEDRMMEDPQYRPDQGFLVRPTIEEWIRLGNLDLGGLCSAVSLLSLGDHILNGSFLLWKEFVEASRHSSQLGGVEEEAGLALLIWTRRALPWVQPAWLEGLPDQRRRSHPEPPKSF
jgi:hypothetical protein